MLEYLYIEQRDLLEEGESSDPYSYLVHYCAVRGYYDLELSGGKLLFDNEPVELPVPIIGIGEFTVLGADGRAYWWLDGTPEEEWALTDFTAHGLLYERGAIKFRFGPWSHG